MNIKDNMPLLALVVIVAYYAYRKQQDATVLDRRYPMAYQS